MATTAKKPPQQAAATATYQVLSPLEHDGEPFAAGADIELDARQAQPLLDVKVIALKPAA